MNANKIAYEATCKSNFYRAPNLRVLLVKEKQVQIPSETPSTSPRIISDIMHKYLEGFDREAFVVIMLDTKKKIIAINTVTIGTLNCSIAHPREVFKPAIIAGADSIIVCHNHPSGDTKPSVEDERITERIMKSGDLLGIPLLDHVIIGDGYYSFHNAGFINRR